MGTITVIEKIHTAGQSPKLGRAKIVSISEITSNDKVWVKTTNAAKYLMQRGHTAPLCKLENGITVTVWQPIYSAI